MQTKRLNARRTGEPPLYRWLTALSVLALIPPTEAQSPERVDLELVLLADATGSIDLAEIQSQRQGYATALQDPEILSAIGLGYDGKIAVTYVEWGDQSSQDIVVPWTIVDGPESAKAFALDITINGLAVLCRHCSGRPVAYDLEQRFADAIVTGPASFAVTADREMSFAEAVRKTLLLEIAGIESEIAAWNEAWEEKALAR